MKKNMNLKKSMLVNALVFSLIQTQTFSIAYALDSGDVRTASQILGNVGNQILSTKASMMQQQMMQQQMMNIQKQLQPQYSASKYFPECKLPNSMQNIPANACSVSNNPNQLGTMYGYEAAAQNMINFYDQMMNEATPLTSVGAACLNNSKKNVDAQLTEMINNLTRLQTQLKEESQVFREANKAILNEMEETNLELMGSADGGSSRNSVQGKTRDFTKLISPSCQKVIGGNVSAQGEAGGFNGLLKIASTKNSAAYNFNQSKSQIETELKAQVQNLKDSIADMGLDNWATATGAANRSQMNIQDKLSSYPALSKIIISEKQGLLAQKSRIANEIRSLAPDFDVPSMDKNSSSDLGNFINGSQDYFKKKYVNDCTLNSSKGVAIDVDKIIGSIEQKNTDNSPAAIQGYKQALANILNSDAYISDKLEQIKALESTYKGMTVTYTNAGGSTTTQTPYDLLAATEQACAQRYSEDQTFSKSKANGLSEKEKTKRVQALLQEYKNLQDNFASRMGNNIVNTLINCNGESLKATDTCDEKTIDPGAGNNFCLAKASTCANSMLACYGEINQQVEVRKTKMSNLAKKFNGNVEQMVARANLLFKQQAANVEKLTKLIQTKFPGSNFEIPKDLYIQLPETSKDKFGIEMAGNGDLNKIIEMLPQKIDSLKEMFANQKEASDREMDEYIAKQKEAMSREKARFEKLMSECKNAADQTASNIAKANQKGMEEQAKLDDKVRKFCTKYYGLKTNPNGACKNIDKLAEDASDISQRLDKGAINITYSFRNMCNETNNESSDYSECETAYANDPLKKQECKQKFGGKSSGSSETETPDEFETDLKFEKICPKGKDTTNEDAVKNIVSNLPEADTADLPKKDDNTDYKEVGNYLSKTVSSQKMDQIPVFKWLRSKYLGGTGKFCEQLDKKMREKSGTDSPAQKALATAKTEKDKAEKDLADLKGKTNPAAKPEDIKTAETKASEAGKKFETAQADAAKETPSAALDEELLKGMKKYTLATRGTKSDSPRIKLSKLGEQVTESCDAQSSSMVAQKNPFTFDLNGFDSKILGSGSSR